MKILNERKLDNIIKNAMDRAINESISNEEYIQNFERNVFEANASLYRALTFFNDPKQEPLVRQIKKAFELTNEASYFLEQRRKRK